jgi:hypothetical protein
LLTLSGCRTLAPAPEAVRAPPRAVVAIVIDPFSSRQADARLPELAGSTGFGRCLRDGTWHRQMRFEHGASDTALGHASLFSGQVPGALGVDRNERCMRARHTSAFVGGGAHPVPLGTAVDKAREGPSLDAFPAARGGALVADALREMRGFGTGGGVVGVSLKDRASLFACEGAPDFCAFFVRASAGFATTDRLLGRRL